MKLREIMTKQVVRIRPEESVAVAARLLEHYNIGSLPVCEADGRLCGMVTDRDLVVRCVAAGLDPNHTPVRRVMTRSVTWVRSDMEAGAAAAVMGRQQVRRLPVVENGRLCGMVSLADLAAREETGLDAADALERITSGLSSR